MFDDFEAGKTHKFEEEGDIVTIYGRKTLRPLLKRDQAIDGKAVPDVIYFILPDNAVQQVSTAHDITIGRQAREDDPPVSIDLQPYGGHGEGVSRQHAMIKILRDKLILVDLDSINGTFINGHRAAPLRRYHVLDGDEIICGNIPVYVRFRKP